MATPAGNASRNEVILSSFFLGLVWAVRYADDQDGKSGSLKWLLGIPLKKACPCPRYDTIACPHL